MADDLVKRVDSLMVLLSMERTKSLSLGKHIEKLEAALIDILKVPRSEASWGIALVIAREALEGKDD